MITIPDSLRPEGPLTEGSTVVFMSDKIHTVYIILAEDETLYTGVSNNLERRLKEHRSGYKNSCKLLRNKKNIQLVYFENYNDKYGAYKREKQIKGLSRHKKLDLIKSQSVEHSPIAQR